MQKLSTRYRDDPLIGLPEKLRQYLDREYLDALPNLNAKNPRLLVVFSGGNAMGKSTLSKRIGEELHGLVLENDAMKKCILTYEEDVPRDKLNIYTWQYSMDLYSRLESVTQNRLVVRDGVIDWYYERILPVFETQGYEVFTIGYEISRQKQIELITARARGDRQTVTAERLIDLIADHDIHTARFRKAYKMDYVLHDEDIFDYDAVIVKLRERIARVRSEQA